MLQDADSNGKHVMSSTKLMQSQQTPCTSPSPLNGWVSATVMESQTGCLQIAKMLQKVNSYYLHCFHIKTHLANGEMLWKWAIKWKLKFPHSLKCENMINSLQRLKPAFLLCLYPFFTCCCQIISGTFLGIVSVWKKWLQIRLDLKPGSLNQCFL